MTYCVKRKVGSGLFAVQKICSNHVYAVVAHINLQSLCCHVYIHIRYRAAGSLLHSKAIEVMLFACLLWHGIRIKEFYAAWPPWTLRVTILDSPKRKRREKQKIQSRRKQ